MELKDRIDVDVQDLDAFTMDLMKVEVGLIIARPPICTTLTERDMRYMRFKSHAFKKYKFNYEDFYQEMQELIKTDDSVMNIAVHGSELDLDNYPTHRIKIGQVDGEPQYEYHYGASKYYQKIDPKTTDRKSLHFAPGNQVYLVMKNKKSKQWEFPVGRMQIKNSFVQGKYNLFNSFSGGKWTLRYVKNFPLQQTIRDFTEDEKKTLPTVELNGVRTYYFQALHQSGMPFVDTVNSDYEDWALVPKQLLNEYFEEDYYNCFIDVITSHNSF